MIWLQNVYEQSSTGFGCSGQHLVPTVKSNICGLTRVHLLGRGIFISTPLWCMQTTCAIDRLNQYSCIRHGVVLKRFLICYRWRILRETFAPNKLPTGRRTEQIHRGPPGHWIQSLQAPMDLCLLGLSLWGFCPQDSLSLETRTCGRQRLRYLTAAIDS